MSKRGWTAEDPLVGALVYEESVRQQLPTAFYALRPWRHSRFWVDLREARTLPDATILGARSPTPRLSRLGPCVCTFAARAVPSIPTYPQVHRVYNSMLAKVSAARFSPCAMAPTRRRTCSTIAASAQSGGGNRAPPNLRAA